MNSFWLTAALGGASITAMTQSDKVDSLVSDWEQWIKKIDAGADVRDLAREFVVVSLLEGKHHTDHDVAQRLCQALLWLVVNGPIGERLLPFLRRGGAHMKVHQEITKVGDEGRYPLYNFRTTLDDETSAQMSL